MTFVLNDDAEILVRIKPKGEQDDKEKLAKMMTKSVAMHVVAELPPELAQEFVEKQSEKGIEECSFFFFFPNSRIE